MVAVNVVGRHGRSWSYIQRSTRNREYDGKTDNLWWMLYWVYAILSINLWSWHGEIERNDLTFCSAMMVDKVRWGMKMGVIWRIPADIRSQGTTYLIGFKRHHISVITHRMRSSTCCIRNGILTRTQNSLKSQFLMMMSPISSHLSLTLPSTQNMKLSHPSLSLYAVIIS